MKLKIYAVLFFAFLLGSNSKAQNWREMMSQPGKYSFKQICDNFYQEERQLYSIDSVAASKRKGIKAFKRWEWFWQQRLNPDGSYPDVNKHFEDWQLFKNSTHTNNGFNNATENTNRTQLVPNYTNLGPFQPSSSFPAYGVGNIVRLEFHPTNTNIFYALSDGGHVFKTVDGGASYQSMTDNLPHTFISDIIVDYSNGNNIKFLPDNNKSAVALNFYYNSIDGGTTWTKVTLPLYFREFEQDPLNAQTYIALDRDVKIRKSTDGGLTWNIISGNIGINNSPVSNLRFKANSSSILFANQQDFSSSSAGIRFIRSLDGGATWTQTAHFQNASSYYATLATVNTNPDLVEVLTVKTGGVAMDALYKSTDGGTSFTKIYDGSSATTNLLASTNPPNSSDGQASRNRAVCINPNNTNQQFIGGIHFYKSDNGGVTWQSPASYIASATTGFHVDQQHIVYNPYNTSVLYISNDGGIYKSTDNASTTQRISNNLSCSQIYRVSTPQAASAGTQAYLLGFQDNGTSARLNNGTYNFAYGGDGMDNAIDPINSDFIYVSYQYGGFARKQLSNLNGIETVISPSSNGAWVTPIAVDTSFRTSATQPPRLFIVYPSGLYKSLNRGTSWTLLPNTPWSASTYPTILSVSDSSTIIVSNWDEVWRTTNSGGTWVKILTSAAGTRTYKAITVDPQNKNRIWVTTSSSSQGYVIYSNDGGTTWQNWSYNLPAAAYNAIEIQKSPVELLYVSSNNGIAVKGEAATSWVAYGNGLPNVAINEIQLDKNNNQVAIATYGRGLWTAPAYSIQNGGTCTVTNGTNFTVGNTLKVNFNFERLFFNAGNTYTVQLSGLNANFSTPSNLGTKISSNGLDSVSVVLPNGLVCGTTYRVRVIASNGMDTTSVSSPFTIIVKPEARITNNTANNSFCSNGSLQLNAFTTTGYTYQWKLNGADISGATSSTYAATVAGNYQVKVTDNCSDSTSAIYTVVLIPSPTAPTVTAGGTTTFCAGANVVLTSNASAGNQWYNGATLIAGATNTSYTANTAGTYTSAVTVNGCTSTASNTITTVVNPLPTTPVINWNSTVLSTTAGLSSYSWFLNGTVIAGASTSTYTPTASGLYTVQVTDANSCSATSAAYNFVSTALNNVTLEGATVQVSPNPASSFIRIKVSNANGNNKLTATLFDNQGKLILQNKLVMGNNQIDISILANGQYMLQIKGTKEVKTIKINIIK
jgi:photosystem II stability/assembly factor-like uncharacterized protein